MGTHVKRCLLLPVVAAAVCATSLSVAAALTQAAPARTPIRSAVHHYACSGPNSAHVPCHFSTPSGNIRCLWTPNPNNVACVMLSNHRAYRLRPSGPAAAIRLTLSRRGATLPTDQGLVFTENLSCNDTRTTMTCNQDYDLGEFTLSPHGSHSR